MTIINFEVVDVLTERDDRSAERLGDTIEGERVSYPSNPYLFDC
jgi:hypothetical protein